MDYDDTYMFFRDRAQKFDEGNPYAVTMYQDGHPELVRERNAAEMEKLLPLLQVGSSSKVLDIACGIGRWSDALGDDIGFYCDTDFSPELIHIAQTRNKERPGRRFLVGAAQEVREVLIAQGLENFDRILLMGILIYLNDGDALSGYDAILRNFYGDYSKQVRGTSLHEGMLVSTDIAYRDVIRDIAWT